MLSLAAVFIPTFVALHLATGGLERPPTPGRAAWTATAAALLGPVTIAFVGFLGWLVLVAAAVGAMTAYALWRRPGQRQALRG